MAKFQSPLLGYNNNVRHKNRVFHIQTEDSGVNHPHIITHLFMDGGRILKSVKKSYAEHVGADGMNDIVRGMMKEQHKAIFIALRDGQFDHLVDPAAAAKAAAAAAEAAASSGVDASAETAVAPTAAAAATDAATKPTDAAMTAADAKATAPEIATTAEADAQPEAPPSDVPSAGPPTTPEPSRPDAVELAPNTIDEARRPTTGSLPPSAMEAASATAPRVVLPANDPDDVPMTTRQHVEPPAPSAPSPTSASSALAAASPPAGSAAGARATSPSGRELTLDFDALEQAAQDAVAAPSLFHASDLPPPPKNLFAREPGTGAYRAVETEPRHAPRSDPRPDPRLDPREERARSDPREEPGSRTTARREPPPPPPSTRGERAAQAARQPTRAASGSRPPGEARYAPARPAAIFGSTQRPPPQSSLFSDELVSDKSLDEVILSYLAEDLEPPRQK